MKDMFVNQASHVRLIADFDTFLDAPCAAEVKNPKFQSDALRGFCISNAQSCDVDGLTTELEGNKSYLHLLLACVFVLISDLVQTNGVTAARPRSCLLSGVKARAFASPITSATPKSLLTNKLTP